MHAAGERQQSPGPQPHRGSGSDVQRAVDRSIARNLHHPRPRLRWSRRVREGVAQPDEVARREGRHPRGLHGLPCGGPERHLDAADRAGWDARKGQVPGGRQVLWRRRIVAGPAANGLRRAPAAEERPLEHERARRALHVPGDAAPLPAPVYPGRERHVAGSGPGGQGQADAERGDAAAHLEPDALRGGRIARGHGAVEEGALHHVQDRLHPLQKTADSGPDGAVREVPAAQIVGLQGRLGTRAQHRGDPVAGLAVEAGPCIPIERHQRLLAARQETAILRQAGEGQGTRGLGRDAAQVVGQVQVEPAERIPHHGPEAAGGEVVVELPVVLPPDVVRLREDPECVEAAHLVGVQPAGRIAVGRLERIEQRAERGRRLHAVAAVIGPLLPEIRALEEMWQVLRPRLVHVHQPEEGDVPRAPGVPQVQVAGQEAAPHEKLLVGLGYTQSQAHIAPVDLQPLHHRLGRQEPHAARQAVGRPVAERLSESLVDIQVEGAQPIHQMVARGLQAVAPERVGPMELAVAAVLHPQVHRLAVRRLEPSRLVHGAGGRQPSAEAAEPLSRDREPKRAAGRRDRPAHRLKGQLAGRVSQGHHQRRRLRVLEAGREAQAELRVAAQAARPHHDQQNGGGNGEPGRVPPEAP